MEDIRSNNSFLDKNYEPDTKVEMLGAEFTELIHQQLNGSRSLVRRASKIIGRMSHDYKKKLSKCEDYAGTEHGEDNRYINNGPKMGPTRYTVMGYFLF